MFKIDKVKKIIHLTRGDVACIKVQALQEDEVTLHTFSVDDIVRFRVMEVGNCDNVVLTVEKKVEQEGTDVRIRLLRDKTRIGAVIDKPVKYWYEVEVNPDTNPQTIVGYDEKGPKIFILYPEGVDPKEGEV